MRELLGHWSINITADCIAVARPLKESTYRCAGRDDEEAGTTTAISGPTLSFDTRTGEEVLVPASCVVPEPVHHPTNILQWIRIGSSDVLVFFNRGGSLNLIQGDIAEREGLSLVSNSPGKLRVGRGMEIHMVYGIYRVPLRPTADREYLEVTCRGLPLLTDWFTEHSLYELNEEVYKLGAFSRDVPLPRVLGRSSLGLLICITCTRRTPSWYIHYPTG